MQAHRAKKAEEKAQKAIDQSATDLVERRRNRLTNDQKEALMAEYEARKSFSRQTCEELAEKFDLKIAQVYKWGYDFRKSKSKGVK